MKRGPAASGIHTGENRKDRIKHEHIYFIFSDACLQYQKEGNEKNSNLYKSLPSQCTNPKVLNENVLERYMIENLSSMIEKTVVEYEAAARPARDKAARIAKLQGKVDKLKELFINDLISLEEYKSDKEKLTAQIEALQAEAAEEPTVNTEALKQLQGMNFRGIYEGMDPDEKRRLWRAIIKVIWFDEERNINVEFL